MGTLIRNNESSTCTQLVSCGDDITDVKFNQLTQNQQALQGYGDLVLQCESTRLNDKVYPVIGHNQSYVISPISYIQQKTSNIVIDSGHTHFELVTVFKMNQFQGGQFTNIFAIRPNFRFGFHAGGSGITNPIYEAWASYPAAPAPSSVVEQFTGLGDVTKVVTGAIPTNLIPPSGEVQRLQFRTQMLLSDIGGISTYSKDSNWILTQNPDVSVSEAWFGILEYQLRLYREC